MQRLHIFHFFFLSIFLGKVSSRSCLATPQAAECLEILGGFANLTSNYNMTDATTTTPTIQLCQKFKKCSPIFSCDPAPVLVNGIKTILLFCETMEFFTGPIHPCQLKLDANTTECSRAWNPLPKVIPDKKKMEEIQKEACKNFFGKNGCMKEEVTEKCGIEQWEGFRKYNLALNTIIGACQFKDGQP